MARPQRPLTVAEERFCCARCGAEPGERCVNPGGKFYSKGAHAPRERQAESLEEYTVTACGNCSHPGGQHIIDKGCRLCRDCPGWAAGAKRKWSDRMTDKLLRDARAVSRITTRAW